MIVKEFAGKSPKIHPSAFVAENTVIIGDVEIGEGSSVWYGAVIRGDFEPIRIGRGTSIQDNCVLHGGEGFPLKIGDNVTVGHGAIVHGATVEDNALIGMGSTVLNGARVGRSSIVAAGALVKEGQEIEDGSMAVGVPAHTVRRLSPQQLEDREKTSEYVLLARTYLETQSGGSNG